jgi:hypothetical protein
MATLEQRVGHLEGAFEHLATKADLAELKAELKGDINRMTMWMAGVLILGMAGSSSIALIVQRLLD